MEKNLYHKLIKPMSIVDTFHTRAHVSGLELNTHSLVSIQNQPFGINI